MYPILDLANMLVHVQLDQGLSQVEEGADQEN
jgi:hypothetical protein